MKHNEENKNMWKVVDDKKGIQHKPTEMEKWIELKNRYYGENVSVQTEWGIIDFNPDGMKDVVGIQKITYDEYLDILMLSRTKVRHDFELLFYNCVIWDFKGEIEKISNGNICFKRINALGLRDDGIQEKGKEDHVWMKEDGFENYTIGDCLQFSADIYRYVKTSKGIMIDYSLRNPEGIIKIEKYEVPSDEEMLMQFIDELICENCMYSKHCYMGMCIANEQWRENMRKILFAIAQGDNQ